MEHTNVTDLTAAEQALVEVWQQHLYDEFVEKDASAAVSTMTEDAYVNSVPLALGATGKQHVHDFYSRLFLAQLPPDLEYTLVSRTVGQNRVVDELVFRFTHSLRMEWLAPGVAPTGKRVEVAIVGIIQFRDGRISQEHLYWDQASVLVQLGLLAEGRLPVAGARAARHLLEPVVTQRHGS